MGTSITTGGANIAIGSGAGPSLLSGANNTFIGTDAGSGVTTGSSNICIGRSATASGIGNSNDLAIGSATYFVASNGAATTYFTTATATSTGVLPATCGFIRILLNGTFVKIPVYAN